jgi:glycosyltransferase involved in cell wall biosynthesis
MHISVVSPVYKAPKILPELVERLEISLSKIADTFDIILVDDDCPWDSWSVIEVLCKKYPFVRGIKLSRNFGQHYAITAGLDHVKGDWIVVMDCDLQDQPEEIYKLINESKKGYDLVLAARKKRKDGFFKRYFSIFFYKVLSYLSGATYDARIANFGLYSKKVIESVNKFREPIRYFPGLIQYVGFKTSTVEIEHASRSEGKTSYNIKRLFKLATDIILAYSDKPLRIIVKIGLFISLVSFMYVGFSLWQWYNGLILVPGFTSLIASIWFLSGVTISTLGIVGLYLGKTFDASKQRPIYLVSETIN